MPDEMDLVRRHYQAVNARDLEAVAGQYQRDCVTEGIFLADPEPATCRGRDANRGRYAVWFDRYDGGLEGDTFFQPRTIGGLETGWGWVQTEWVAGFVPRAGGEGRWFAGYSHFLIEDGLIRRQRSVATPATLDEVRRPRARRAESRAYPARPIVGVGAVVFVEGRVLLVRRRSEPLAGQWSLPGGTLELGETLEAGVAREVLEETGLVVDVGPIVEVFDRILLDERRKIRFHFVLVDYLCDPIGGRLEHGSDVSAVTLADPDDLGPYDLTRKAAAVVAKARRMQIDRAAQQDDASR